MNLVQFLRAQNGPFPVSQSNSKNSDILLVESVMVKPEQTELNLGEIASGKHSFSIEVINAARYDIEVKKMTAVSSLNLNTLISCTINPEFSSIPARSQTTVGVDCTISSDILSFDSLIMSFYLSNSDSFQFRVSYAVNPLSDRFLSLPANKTLVLSPGSFTKGVIESFSIDGMLSHAEIKIDSGFYEKSGVSTDSINLKLGNSGKLETPVYNNHQISIFKFGVLREADTISVGSRTGKCFNLPLSQEIVINNEFQAHYGISHLINNVRIIWDSNQSVKLSDISSNTRLLDDYPTNTFRLSLVPVKGELSSCHTVSFVRKTKKMALRLNRDHSNSVLEPVRMKAKLRIPERIDLVDELEINVSTKVIGIGKFTVLCGSQFVRSDRKIITVSNSDPEVSEIDFTILLDHRTALHAGVKSPKIPLTVNLSDGRIQKYEISTSIINNKVEDSVDSLLPGIKVYPGQIFTQEIRFNASNKVKRIEFIQADDEVIRSIPLTGSETVQVDDNISITSTGSNALRLSLNCNPDQTSANQLKCLTFNLITDHQGYEHEVILDYRIEKAELQCDIDRNKSGIWDLKLNIKNVSNTVARISNIKAMFGILWELEGRETNGGGELYLSAGEVQTINVRVAQFLRNGIKKTMQIYYNNQKPLLIDIQD